ncbi:MAG: TPM domain-containing protein [Treponema sp.]|nr:TPM domain-containing protein [Treponema sp.]
MLTAFQKKLRLGDDALERIARAVQEAEKSTDGEIVVAVAKESSRYSFWELLAAVVCSVLIFAALLPVSDAILSLCSRLFWVVPSWYVPAFYGISTFALISILFYVANIPAVDRLVVPRFVRNACVTSGAFRLFAESGVYDTVSHSGILVYVSVLERQVRILADSGISKKISQDMWNLIADDLSAGLGEKNYEQAIVSTVQKCGELLSQHFPAQKEAGNELPNGLILLESAGWN